MREIRPTSFLLIVTLFAAAAAAAPSGAQAQTLPRFDQQIVVTPARAESTIARVPAFVTLIDADDIAASPARDIPDLLRQAGVQVTDITGNGRSYRVDLRGFGATAGLNTLVLVDGRRVNQPDLSGSDWSQIPLDRIARIEVIRGGGGAVAFGDNAAGGVVNIITTRGGETETQLAFGAGAYSTVAPELSSRGTRGNVSYAVSARYRRSDGHRENAQTEGGNVSGQLAVRPHGAFELGLSGGYHADKTGLPGALRESALASGLDRSDSVTPDDFADVDDMFFMATPRFTLGTRGHALVDVSVRQRDSLIFSSFTGGEFSGDTGIRTVAVSPKAVFLAPLGSTTHRIVAGVDLATAEEDISNTVIFGGPPDVGLFTLKKASRAAYLRDEASTGALTLTGGYRYDSAGYTFTPSTPSERDFHAHAGDVGATVRVNEQASLFAGVSRSFRYPVLDELFDFFSNTILTGLDPQSSVGLEGGIRVDAGVAQASVSVFRLVTDDEIFFNPAGGPFGSGANENLDGTSRRSGLTVAISTLVGRVDLGGTATVLDTTIEGGRYDGEEMPGVAPWQASVLARLPLSNRLSLGLDGSYTGARRFEGDFGDEFGRQDGYFVLDAKLTLRQGRARLFVDLKNLLDEEYSEYGVIGRFPTERAYYPSPGIHAFAGVDFTF
jgi:iron complex outermembrane receptor protein